MPLIDSSHPLADLLQRDRRYPLDAYVFILEALSFAQEALGMGQEPPAEELTRLGGSFGSSWGPWPPFLPSVRKSDPR